MSITVSIRLPCGTVHAIDVAGSETLSRLLTRVRDTTQFELSSFDLHFEGRVLCGGQNDEHVQVHRTNLTEGCEIDLVPRDPMRVHVADLLTRYAAVEQSVSQALESDPGRTLVVDVTGFKGELALETIPPGVFHVAFACDPSDPGNITKLTRFLTQCEDVETVDLTGLQGVKEVSDGFLSGCTGLLEIDLTPLSCVDVVGGDFMCGCSGLEGVDLGPLGGVVEVGGSFLGRCSSLKTLDLSPLRNVAAIGPQFAEHCTGLESISWTAPSALTSIDCGFCLNCSFLLSADLTGLSNVSTIGYSFLQGCCDLRTLDLSTLTAVTDISGPFLHDQCMLEDLAAPPGLLTAQLQGTGLLPTRKRKRNLTESSEEGDYPSTPEHLFIM